MNNNGASNYNQRFYQSTSHLNSTSISNQLVTDVGNSIPLTNSLANYQSHQWGQVKVSGDNMQFYGQHNIESIMQPTNCQQISPFAYYCALLGLAETFRTMSPPNIRLCVHCLKSILHYKLPGNLEARTYLHIGKILLIHSKSDDQIKFYLEKARALGAHLKPPDDVIKFEAADLLSDLFEKKGKRSESICVLMDALRLSEINPYWHCRLLLKLSSAYVADKNILGACEVLAMGSEFAQQHQSDYTKGLFLLSKCMLLLSIRRPDVNNSLTVATHLIDNLNGTPYQKEALRIFQLVIQISQILIGGGAKSAKLQLKQLHTSIQQFAAME